MAKLISYVPVIRLMDRHTEDSENVESNENRVSGQSDETVQNYTTQTPFEIYEKTQSRIPVTVLRTSFVYIISVILAGRFRALV